MKIKYESVTGEVTQVEVSDEIGSIIIESRKAEHAQDERQRYHCPYSTNALLFEGLEYSKVLLTSGLRLHLTKSWRRATSRGVSNGLKTAMAAQARKPLK